jgi:hypothetical protein
MTKLNLDLADPNCDVKALFADFIYEYDNTLAKPVQIDVYSVQVWACGSITEITGLKKTLTLSEVESEMELCNALIHIWIKAGFIKSTCSSRSRASHFMLTWRYQITTKGCKK